MILDQFAHEAFKADVLKRWPQEACGLVIGGNYFPCANVHSEPTQYFKIDGAERIQLERTHGTVQAVLHSHPYRLVDSRGFNKKYNPAWPSVPDQAGFISEGVNWGIVASDGEGISDFVWLHTDPQPLQQREFSWFSADCYAAVRDWYRLNRNFTLPNFTREWDFWKKGINTIEDNLMTIPHEKLPTEKAQIGDTAAFAMFGSSIVNHVAVICDQNKILHQFAPGDNQPKSYAHERDWHIWAPTARYVIRFEI